MMRLIAQHKALVVSLALLAGAVALAPAMAGTGHADLTGGALTGDVAGHGGSATGNANVKTLAPVKGGAAGVAGSVTGAVKGDLPADASAAALANAGVSDLGNPSADAKALVTAGDLSAKGAASVSGAPGSGTVNTRAAVAGGVAAGDASLTVSEAAAATDKNSHLNTHVVGTSGANRVADFTGLDPHYADLSHLGADVHENANLASSVVSGAATGSAATGALGLAP